jgi:hypothetical protein
MTRTIAAALFVALGLSGCSPTMYNLPPGGTRQQFAADQAFCNAQAQTAVGNASGFFGLSIFESNKEMCMEGKGYIKAD